MREKFKNLLNTAVTIVMQTADFGFLPDQFTPVVGVNIDVRSGQRVKIWALAFGVSFFDFTDADRIATMTLAIQRDVRLPNPTPLLTIDRSGFDQQIFHADMRPTSDVYRFRPRPLILDPGVSYAAYLYLLKRADLFGDGSGQAGQMTLTVIGDVEYESRAEDMEL